MNYLRVVPWSATPSRTQARDCVICATILWCHFPSFWTRQRKPLEFAFLKKSDVQVAKDKSIIELLRDFAGKKCTVPRDHFYSVFALCEEREDLIVDYSSRKLDLVYHVL